MIDFKSILSKPVDSVEAPKPLPMGTYTFVIVSHRFDESSKKHTPYIEFLVKPLSAGSDVDATLLPEGWQGKEMRHTFYLTEDALFRLRDFLEKDLALSTSGRTFDTVIPETTNQQFLGTVAHQAAQNDATKIFANITSTARAA